VNSSSITAKTMLAVLFVLAGCAAPVIQQEQSGFLSDYSKLELLEDGRIIYVSDNIIEYKSFIIDPIVILFERDADYDEFTDSEIEKFKKYLVKEITEQLTKGDRFSVVSEPGPGVGRFRFGITDVDDTIGVLNLSIYTKITGLGLGGLAVEGELVDSVTGEQLMAAIRWGSGSRVMRAGLTHMGDAKIAVDKWARDLRRIFDEMHGD
jgi:hypothetical protein